MDKAREIRFSRNLSAAEYIWAAVERLSEKSPRENPFLPADAFARENPGDSAANRVQRCT